MKSCTCIPKAGWKASILLGLLLSCALGFAQSPSITSLSPTSGVAGMQVEISGSGFGTSQGSSAVSLNGTSAVTTSWSDSMIGVIVPAGASSGFFSVTVNGQAAYSSSFTVAALPSGWTDGDVGTVGVAGSASYANGTFTINGAGYQIFGTADAFNFVYQQLSGDGSIVARVVSMPAGATAGVTIRETLDPASANGKTAEIYGGYDVAFDVRTAAGWNTIEPAILSALAPPYWVKLVRRGSTLSSYLSPDGVNWTFLANQTVNMAQNVYVGLAVDSGNTSSPATATFDNVSVSSTSTPAPVITGVSVTTGAVGGSVTITGSNFGAPQGAGVVTLNAAPVTINSWSNTSISITIPTGATSGLLVVSVAPSMNDSNPLPFTVTTQPLPSGWLDGDVGAVGVPGNASYANGTFTVNGAGAQISNAADAFHFVYQPISGDGTIVARVVSMTATAPAGVMIRESLQPASANGKTALFGTWMLFDARTAAGGTTSEPGSVPGLAPPYWVELVRSGSNLSSYTSPDGVNWTLLGNQTVNLAQNVYVGLAVDSGNTSSLATATFDNVSVSSTAAPAPVITDVSATTAAAASSVTITGSNFGVSQGSSVVTLNAAAVTINSWSDSSISITIPSGATSGLLVVAVAPSMNNSNPVAFTVTSQPLPSAWLDGDVGAVGVAGNAGYASGTFTVNGAGAQISNAADAFHFVYQQLSGDGTTVARVASMAGVGTAGVMIRETLDPASANGVTALSGGWAEFNVRAAAGGNTSEPGSVPGLAPPYWVELVRSGSTISSYTSPDGATWTLLGSQTVTMAQNEYVGLVVDSGNTSALATATFDNVSVSFGAETLAPSITVLSPNTAILGAPVTITGENLGSTQGSSTVSFNGTSATALSWSATSIVVAVPSAATNGNVVVTVNGASSNAVSFTVSQAPTIASMSPTSGTVGSSVTITGISFGSTQGSSTVTFNGTGATPASWSGSSIVVPVPAGTTTGTVLVTINGVASNGLLFRVLETPSIASLSPASGTISNLVTITGTNFGSIQGSSMVTFNGTLATPASWSATSIVVPIPVGATTGNVVATVNGLASNSASMTVVTYSLPPVAQVQPANGATGTPLNGRVMVRFAEPVQSQALVSGAITLSQGTNSFPGTLALSNDALSVTFTPAGNLPANATVAVAVTDITGNQTSPEFQSSFTTGSTTDTVAPTIIQTSPQGGNTGVPISAPVVVQFSKPMDPATLTPQALYVTDGVTGNQVAGMIQVDPTGLTASFVPQAYLGVGRLFQVVFEATMEDSSGNNLAGGSSFSFTTSFAPDTGDPQMVGTSPSDGSTAVPLNALVVLEFNKPLNIITVANGFQVLSGGQPVQGSIALSNSNQQITFTPLGGLSANAAYSVVTTSAITDVGGLPLSNPGTFSFTAGAAADMTTPSITNSSPTNGQTGAPLNGVVQLEFSKPIDPLTATSTAIYLLNLIGTYPGTLPVPGTIAVSSDNLSATFTPSVPLDAFAIYAAVANSGITDMEGQPLSYFQVFFNTGVVTDSSAPTVLTVSPANGTIGVPANVRVDLVMSAQLSAASVGSNSVVVSTGGVPVSGNVSLSTSGTTLTFAPANLLATSTTYSVTASGVTDQAGNAVVAFTSSFTTGTAGGANTTTPSVATVSPLYGASAVSVSSSIVLTFNEALDATTLNNTTVPVSVSSATGVLAGGYSLDSTGTVVTFTPLSPLPGNVTVTVQVNSGLLDLSGNAANSFYSTFTTGTGTDTTAPTVTMVTPQNGATGIGPYAVVVLTFSKSLNPGTVNANNFALLINGSPVEVSISTSADNRVVTLYGFQLPVSSTITVLATSGVTDLSGNALANFESQFTMAPAFATGAVVSERPGNGATGVPLNTNVVLYMSEPMNESSVQSALQVSENGLLVAGTTQVTDNGQVAQFTPLAPWQPSALVQVFLTSAAESAGGNNLNSYQASFTTLPSPTTTAPALVSLNPAYLAVGVPTNIVMDFAFSEALDATALAPTSVACSQDGTWLQTGVSLIGGGTVLQVTPRLPLADNTLTICQLGSGIQGVNGLALSAISNASPSFTTGAGPDTVVPTIVTTSPPSGSSNVGDNADVRLVFSKPINPLTVTASTIQLSGGGVTAVPDSISFSNNNESVLLVPHAPLPDSTLMTLTISGLTDVAGNPVSAQTTQFTTGTGPDVVPPVVVKTSPSQGATNVPLNTVLMVETSEPIDPGTINSTTIAVTGSNNQLVAGTYSLSTDGLTITFVPSAPLTANSSYTVNFGSSGITDLAGNQLNGSPLGFTTGATSSTSAPQVLGVSPKTGMTGVPINAQLVVQFNEPVDAAKLTGVTLGAGSGTATVSQQLTNGNQTLTMVPVVPLSAGTAYTLTIAGVQDLSGNVLASPVTASFTTGSGADLVPPTVASVSPTNSASSVPTNSAVQVGFSKVIDPLTVTATTFQLYPSSTTIPVAGSISVSTNGQTATLTPSEPLDSLTSYTVWFTSGILDMEGQVLSSSSSYFTTASGTTTLAPTIVTVNPISAAVGGSVTISGTYFGSSQSTSSITFNGVPATTTAWSDTQIVALVPSGATTGNVVVTVNGTAGNGVTYTVLATPSISSISPGSGAAGTAVTITGANLGDSQDSVVVIFNGWPATPTSANNTSLVVPVPASVPPGNITLAVNTNNFSSSYVNFTVIPTPTISTMVPTSGVPGTPVLLYGSYFGDTQGSSTINFNGVPATVTSWSAGTIQAVLPSNGTTGPVTVVENSITSNANFVFSVTSPAIGSLSPPSGAVGATVTLSGSGFVTYGLTTQVLFNGIATYVTQSGSNSLTVSVPQNATSGPVTVEVGSVTSNSVEFTVEQPPAITSVSPSTGPFASDGTTTPITISGSGFGATQSNSTVVFYDSSTAPTIVSWSDSSIEVQVPADATTGPLTVQAGSLTATSPSWFYVNGLTQLTDSLGNQTQYSFAVQGGGWFTSASQGTGCSTCGVRGNITSSPDAYGNTLSTTDDLGNTASFTYDANNNMTSVSKPLNTTTSFTYNSFGEALTVTDALGNTTTNTYDANGNLLSVTQPAPNSDTSASITQFRYNSQGELTQIADPRGSITALTYSSVGLIASMKDAQQNLTSYQYDTRGNRTAVVDAMQSQTSFAYDAGNRLIGITYPDHSTASFAYDVRGRRTSATDQNGKTTTYTYDDADRLTAVTDPANSTTQYAYDTENNLLSITDANGHSTSFAYNARGWVTQTSFPSSLTENYAYDAVGNLTSKTDRKGQTIEYVYDALYRMTQKTYPDSTSADYVYDLVGKVLQVNDPTGTYGFVYDNMGRLIGTTTQYAFLSGATETNAYGYDAASNRTSLTAPDGSTTTYRYDRLNRLNNLANSWAGSFEFGYDALGRRKWLTRPNGIHTTYTYDSLSHLLSVIHHRGTNNLDGASYSYDAAGNRTSKDNYLNGVTSSYSYDPLYELTQVTQSGSTTESYSYDAVGNRLSSSSVSSYSYNASNELTSNSVGSYTYDANGNTTTDSSGKSYTWDFENRLISAAVPGKGTVTFKYDPFGRRIQKTSPWRTITYLYDGDGDNVNEEVAGNGNVLNRFTHTQNIDEPLSGTMSGTISYYEQDAPGSITSVSNPSGTLADTYVYDSFGKLTTSTGTLLNSFRYTGHEFDTETGLYYYRSRYYDDTAGRFISEDPIRFKGGINFYAYVKNNPIVHTDPLGLAPGGTCTCTGSGGKPFAGVCFGYTCECSCETQPEPAAFTMNGLRRDCGWAEKRCPMVVEATSDPRMYGSIVENLHAVKCYDTRPQ